MFRLILLKRRKSCVVPFSYYLRDHLVQVANDGIVSDFHDRSFRVFVDGNDAVGSLHSCQVLDSSGNSAGEIDFRLNGCSGLSNLV